MKRFRWLLPCAALVAAAVLEEAPARGQDGPPRKPRPGARPSPVATPTAPAAKPTATGDGKVKPAPPAAGDPVKPAAGSIPPLVKPVPAPAGKGAAPGAPAGGASGRPSPSPARGPAGGEPGKRVPFGAPVGGGLPVAPLPGPPGADLVNAEDPIKEQCGAKYKPLQKFKFTLKGETDLPTLVGWAAPFFCHAILVPQNLRQSKVTITAPDSITFEESKRLFFAALNSMGLTVQPEGSAGREVYTIIESNRSHELPVPLIIGDGQPPQNDSYITKLTRLTNIGTEDVQQILQRLKSKDGDVVAYAPTQTLIITDLAENVRRMDLILKQLDVPATGAEKIWTVKLHNTAASEMAGMLEKVFQPTKGQPATPAKGRLNLSAAATTPEGAPAGSGPSGPFQVSQIIPEDRSNTLIIVASEKAYQHILALIKRLDQSGGPLDSSSDRLHVYFLANANADDMAGTLGALGVGVARGRQGARSGTSAPTATPGTPGAAGALFESEVKVAADKPTNSLIIVASGRDYIVLRDLIRKLDITRRQVFIEATILEVSLDKARKLGLAFHGGNTIGSGDQQSLLFGGSEPNSSVNSILFSPAALTGLAAGLRGPPIPGADRLLGLPPGASVPSFGVFMQALQNNNDVNVVSMPHILTSDNEKATIQVGRNLPFPGSLGGFPGFGGAGGAPGAAPGGLGFGTSVQRQDVALKMDVTPHVNDSDFVRLELDAEISDVASENFNGLGPATDKRTAKTVISVRDQQSVVIGGLVKDRIAESVDKVPLLGDIPIIGYLFKYTRKTILKQNLLIIITPYVIKDPADLRRIFERKIRDRKEFLERYSAFEDPNSYEAEINYRRKRGLLEEINRTAVDADIEAGELRSAEAAVQGRLYDGPVEPVEVPRGRGSPPPGPAPGPPAGPVDPREVPTPAQPPPAKPPKTSSKPGRKGDGNPKPGELAKRASRLGNPAAFAEED